jgi:hypothetical protein
VKQERPDRGSSDFPRFAWSDGVHGGTRVIRIPDFPSPLVARRWHGLGTESEFRRARHAQERADPRLDLAPEDGNVTAQLGPRLDPEIEPFLLHPRVVVAVGRVIDVSTVQRVIDGLDVGDEVLVQPDPILVEVLEELGCLLDRRTSLLSQDGSWAICSGRAQEPNALSARTRLRYNSPITTRRS